MDSSTVKLPLPDQIIGGRYRLITRLGSGGMGLVFLAEQLGVGNRVAMKFLDPEPTEDESRIARFLQEARVSLEVKHPGAAQILDLGRDEASRLYLVFEYIEGRDLREVLREEGRLLLEEARDITMRLAEVLSFAHVRNIVHRDVKPENIRIRRDLAGVHVKMLDFGIARLLHSSGVRLTAEGSLAGTPRYMAPEQIRDTPVDGRTDIYALGLVFFEMLAGTPAFGGKNISQILLKQVQEPLPLLRSVAPELDCPEVDDVLAHACAKDPDERYASMADFVGALRALSPTLYAQWPAPRFTQAQPNANTRDGKSAGLSDTFVRASEANPRHAPQVAAQVAEAVAPTPGRFSEPPDQRAEAPTEPERAAVERRPNAPSRIAETQVSSRHPRVKPPTPAADERPAIASTVMGVPVPVRPPPTRRPGRRAVVVVLLLLLAGAIAGATWWMRVLLSH